MSDSKYPIGDVLVTDRGCQNPYLYRGECYSGTPRVAALQHFRDGDVPEDLVLWHAPCCGGARVISPREVDWSGMRF